MYTSLAERKYLTRHETNAFLACARRRPLAVHSFCWLMAVTGCRISEALALRPTNIDFEARQVVIECLKKRGKQIFRTVPLPSSLLTKLKQLLGRGVSRSGRLWPWSRMTGYRRIREVMEEAAVHGSHATPKGLRHGFGVRAVQSQVPLNLVQRWLGHADIKTTAIYTSVMGPEEREIAARMWEDERPAPVRSIQTEMDEAPRPSLEVADRSSKHDEQTSKAMDEGIQPVPISLEVNEKTSAYCGLRQNWLKCHTTFYYKSLAYPLVSVSRSISGAL
ncbi:tyrosine-type recombinase/integrase [Sphingomonas nostoxanthinifaciens]|uniref:tyrosine-type recombinase/integrase n=1 Tax=Sphingomonas nostoxanthinifaciens TaxID=2872652 RepID=UPI001CC2122D|nr:site-specific integrase [Sphingomonas nostoxanthinifaciens]UAK22997.1 site-specific integrase [Sphingomonas nostoxanthinifaciens]